MLVLRFEDDCFLLSVSLLGFSFFREKSTVYQAAGQVFMIITTMTMSRVYFSLSSRDHGVFNP